ncbi:MAG: hypothetical protein K5886_06575 [Lachnospiraceae bacterium]|nr:hypothetical protein [Lachnospiraceae bacterium]
MAEKNRFSKLDDNMLDTVSGGAEAVYGMENDPLYQKFSSFWNETEGSKGTGMDSRAEFMNTFRKWVSDGIPENISAWYNGLTGSGRKA